MSLRGSVAMEMAVKLAIATRFMQAGSHIASKLSVCFIIGYMCTMEYITQCGWMSYIIIIM